MDSLLNILRSICFAQPTTTYWLGLSGGLDSCALLHLLTRVRAEKFFKLHAVHVHHGLSPHADAWQQHCAALCREWQVDFSTRQVTINPLLAMSPEDQARQLRYPVFSSLMNRGDTLFTAHHQDDQAETVLLQMLRGAGPKGLSAMPRMKSFAQGQHARPLLDFTRADLQKYAENNQLTWVNDESNHDTHFPRNFLRHDVLPLLKQQWPSLTKTVARVADHCAAAQEWLDEIACMTLETIRGETPGTLDIKKIIQLDSARQQLVLRAWFIEQNIPLPSVMKLQSIQKTVLFAREDKLPCVAWANVEVRRFQNELYVMSKQLSHTVKTRLRWEGVDALTLPSLGVLHALPSASGGAVLTEEISVRFRQGGERIYLHGHHHTLKNLFQAWRIPPWERDRIPLIYSGEILAVIVGFCIADQFLAKEGSGLIFDLKQSE